MALTPFDMEGVNRDKLAAMPEPTPAKQEKDELSAGACDPADPLNLEQSSSYGMTR